MFINKSEIFTLFIKKKLTSLNKSDILTQNYSIPETVATACTEDGHKQNTKTSTTILTERTKEHKTAEEEMKRQT
jgi:hypothetical protein